MISFIQLPRSAEETEQKPSIKPVVIAAILGLILCFQVGLVLWVYFKQWHG